MERMVPMESLTEKKWFTPWGLPYYGRMQRVGDLYSFEHNGKRYPLRPECPEVQCNHAATVISTDVGGPEGDHSVMIMSSNPHAEDCEISLIGPDPMASCTCGYARRTSNTLVRRLRDIAHGMNAAVNQATLREAADEIERLQRENAELEALRDSLQNRWASRPLSSQDQAARIEKLEAALRYARQYMRPEYDKTAVAEALAPEKQP